MVVEIVSILYKIETISTSIFLHCFITIYILQNITSKHLKFRCFYVMFSKMSIVIKQRRGNVFIFLQCTH